MAVNIQTPEGAHFLRDVISCDVDVVEEAAEATGGQVLGPDGVMEVVGDEFDAEFLEAALATVGVIGGVDPLEAATALQERGVRASPIHALGTQNHLSAMPGTDPEPAKVGAEPVIAPASPHRVIGVVDTEVSETLPVWLESGIHPGSDRSAVSEPSHGTFVAGLIRRIAPEHTILVLRARRVPISKFLIDLPRKPHHQGDDPTTELHVYEAIYRMVRILEPSGCDVVALNLSLGGASAGGGDPLMVMLELAIDHWRNAFWQSPVFAAGGNRPSKSPIFPGAFGHVRAVAATQEGGAQVVWDQDSRAVPNPPIPYPGRPWIDDAAPGSRLLSPSGVGRADWVSWSGSSFATAVATGSYASHRPREATGGIVYWPDRATRAADIPGLIV